MARGEVGKDAGGQLDEEGHVREKVAATRMQQSEAKVQRSRKPRPMEEARLPGAGPGEAGSDGHFGRGESSGPRPTAPAAPPPPPGSGSGSAHGRAALGGRGWDGQSV